MIAGFFPSPHIALNTRRPEPTSGVPMAIGIMRVFYQRHRAPMDT